jgi:hypothetical protein
LREEFDQLACAHACLVTLCEVRRLATFETALI